MGIENDSVILKLYEQVERENSSSTEYNEVLSKFNILRDKLDDEIAPSQMEELITLLQLRNEMESKTAKYFFVEGFKLASKLMKEIFYNE